MASPIYTILPKQEPTTTETEKVATGGFQETNLISDQNRPQWKLILQLATLTTALTLVINLSNTVYFAASHGIRDGSSILYKGSCTKIAKLSTWSHIGINILSSILLSGSNTVQQYLLAPTRTELDGAHAAKCWLDIGIPSIRNIYSSRIQTPRRVLWWILALSSIPLHWVYNSALFASLTATQYSVLAVTPSFIDGTTPGFVDPVAHVYNDLDVRATNQSVADIRNVMHTFERLSPAACFAGYAQQVVPGRRDVVVVLDAPDHDVRYCPDLDSSLGCFYADPNITNSLIQIFSSEYGNWVYTSNSYNWLCQDSTDSCSTPTSLDAWKSQWTLYHYVPQYCLSERVEERCTFRMSVPIMLTVCVFNLLKLVCLVLAIFRVREMPLVTVGDAVASFMQRPDPHTAGMALLPRHEFDDTNKWMPRSIAYQHRKVRYFSSASTWKWWVCDLLYVAGIGTIAGLIGHAFASIALFSNTSGGSTWALVLSDGFGKIVSRNLLSLTSSFGASVLLANSPQLILTAIYLTYNALATSLCLTKEYTSYSILNISGKTTAVTTRGAAVAATTSASALRVSFPAKSSSQRRAYYLQLPFRYAIPLVTCSTALHWLTSQSLFLAKVDIYHAVDAHTPRESEVIDTQASLATTGFSVLPMICALIIAATMTLILNGVALQTVGGGMPVAGSSSAAIAAACHGVGSGLGPVTWGAVAEESLQDEDRPASRLLTDSGTDITMSGPRLGFVDGLAGRPVPGQFYS